jgi:hypothetical protein
MEVLSAVGQMVHRAEFPAAAATENWHQELQLPASLSNGHYLLRVTTPGDNRRQTLVTLPFVLQK